MCLCRVKRQGDPSWTARLWKSPMHARLGERLSIHCSSLSCAFVHQKGDYSVNPALCHSQFYISKSTNMSALMHEETISSYLPFCYNYVWHVVWLWWRLQKIITCGTNVIIVLTATVGALLHHLCCAPCVCLACSRSQQSTPVRGSDRAFSVDGYHVSASSATSHFLQMPYWPFIDSSTDSQQPTHVQSPIMHKSTLFSVIIH